MDEILEGPGFNFDYDDLFAGTADFASYPLATPQPSATDPFLDDYGRFRLLSPPSTVHSLSNVSSARSSVLFANQLGDAHTSEA